MCDIKNLETNQLPKKRSSNLFSNTEGVLLTPETEKNQNKDNKY